MLKSIGRQRTVRRYNSIIGVDKIEDIEPNSAINSYKPSKCNAPIVTLMDSVGEEGFFNYNSEDNYVEEMDLLDFTKNVDTIENYKDIVGLEKSDDVEYIATEEDKNTNVCLIVGIPVCIILVVVINILL